MKKKLRTQPPVFCTDCHQSLEEFCFSPEAGNLERLRAAAFRCSVTGVRRGRVCAKLFIAEDGRFTTLFKGEKKRSPAGSRERLRGVILRAIRDEAGRRE